MALQATDFMDAVPLLQIGLIFCSAQLFEYNETRRSCVLDRLLQNAGHRQQGVRAIRC